MIAAGLLFVGLCSLLETQASVMNYAFQPYAQQPLQQQQQQYRTVSPSSYMLTNAQQNAGVQTPQQQWTSSLGLATQSPTHQSYASSPSNSYLQYMNGLQNGAFDMLGTGTQQLQSNNLYYPGLTSGAQTQNEHESIVSPTSNYVDPTSMFNNIYNSANGGSTDGLLGLSGSILGNGDDSNLVDNSGDSHYFLSPSTGQAYQSTLDAATQQLPANFQITPEAAEHHKQQDERLRQLLIKHFATSPFHRTQTQVGNQYLSPTTSTYTANQPQQQYSLPLSSYYSV